MKGKRISSTTSSKEPTPFSTKDLHHGLGTSHYLLEPLASQLEPTRFPCGWKVRFIGRYEDTGEEVELGGGKFWGNTVEETQDAYREAQARGEEWIRHGGYFVLADTNEEVFPEQLEQLVNRELRESMAIHSDEFRVGMLDVLRFHSDGKAIPFRFPEGTAQFDAYYAGKWEGQRLWEKLLLGRKTTIDAAVGSKQAKDQPGTARTRAAKRLKTPSS